MAGRERATTLVPALTQGIVLGVLEVVVASSFAALVFTGPLAVHLPMGIGLSLFAAAATLILVGALSSLPGAVASVQDSTAAVMALAAAGIAATLPPEAPETFLTVVLAIGLASILAGAFYLLLGAFRLGDLVRFVPYPVVGGFLAGTGWLIAKGAVGVLSGLEVTLGTVGDLFASDAAARWVPGLLFGVTLLLLLRWRGHVMLIPAMVGGGILVFYSILLGTGTPIAEAEAAGWLLGPFPEAGLWRPWMMDAVVQADWGVVLQQAASLGTVVLVGILALLLNASGIELIANRDVDLNRELRAAGAANLVSGLGGGFIGFHALSLTGLAQRSGARSRLVGVIAGAICGGALVVGASVMSLFPRPVLGGLLLFLGLSFLVEWVIDAWSRLPRTDYLIVLSILLVIAAFGFLEGVALGLALAVVLFVVHSSQVDVLKHTLSAATLHSNVDRSEEEREVLRDRGNEVHVFQLQGFLFFGTANRLLERVRERAADPWLPPIRLLVLDFKRVIGLDSSAVLSFTKAAQLAERQGFTLVLSGLEGRTRARLARGGVEEGDRIRTFEDLDRAMEWCEDRLIEEAGIQPHAATSLLERLVHQMGARVEHLLPHLERVEVPEGHELIRQGDPAGDVFFLESGRLTAELRQDDGDVIRLRSMGPGTVVGEVAMYLGTARTASVVAERPSVLYRLSGEKLAGLERTDPAAAAAVHRLFARLLSDRLSDTLGSMSALMD